MVNGQSQPCPSYSNSPDNQSQAGTNSWIGHVYAGTSFQNYKGQYAESETFNQSFGGSQFCFPITSGGSSRTIYTEQFSVRYRMNSSRKGIYVADLGSDDGSRLIIDGSLVYDKVDNPGIPDFARKTSLAGGSGKSFFGASLFTGGGLGDLMADGNVVAFNAAYSDSLDARDALKLMNSAENFGIRRAGKILAVEARNNTVESDTIFYNISQLKARTYQLRFAPENMQVLNLDAWLVDQFLKTNTRISLTDSSFVNITVTADPKSFAVDRFHVIFKANSTLPVTSISVAAAAKEKDVVVKWRVTGQVNIKQYEIERSTDGVVFSRIATVEATGDTYSWTDSDVPQGVYYYRIKSVDSDGKESYSKAARVEMSGGQARLSVNPNPVIDGTIYLHFSQESSGAYKLRLLHASGQVIFSGTFHHAAGSGPHKISPSQKLARGIYQLEITKPDGSVEVVPVVSQK